MLARGWWSLAEIFAINAVLEFPRSTLRGRDEIREHLFARDVRLPALEARFRHETADPDVLVVEWLAGDHRWADVVRVGAGGIEVLRSYGHPLA
ncbi:nuclear transport factor 2 family protein [Amycolatopsis bartoniae]|nr:nuclear transport factor 2 family protein [Amycolatopsis bartoniae]